MPRSRTPEARLRRAAVIAGIIVIAALVAMGCTELRGPGRGYLAVFAIALVLTISISATMIRRHRHRRTWPGSRQAE